MITVKRTVALMNRGIKNYFFQYPFCVSFEVTHRCNTRCKHCHLGVPIKEKRATPERYGEICRQIKPVVAMVSGGEPLLRKDIEQIIRALKDKNGRPYIVMTTNAILLTIEKYLQLRQVGVDQFSISLDYPDERHNEFRRKRGLFKKIQTLIETQVQENDKPIVLSCVVQKDNFRELIKMAELGKKWNVKVNYSAYTCLRTHDKNYMLTKEDLPEFKEIIKHLLYLKKVNKNITTSEYIFGKMIEYFETGVLSHCLAGRNYFVVNADGTFSPCGLIMTQYTSQKEIIQKFSRYNACELCYTSLRANSEKPLQFLIKDSLQSR